PLRLVLHLLGFVRLQDLALPLPEDGHQRLEARPPSADRAGIEMDGAREFLFRQPAHAAVKQQVVERRRNHVRRWLRRAPKVERGVPLVSVDAAAKLVAGVHVILSVSPRADGERGTAGAMTLAF